MSKSASMNRLYMEFNLVVGYLANNPINTLNQTLNLSSNTETMDERNREESENKSGLTGEETDVSIKIYLRENLFSVTIKMKKRKKIL